MTEEIRTQLEEMAWNDIDLAEQQNGIMIAQTKCGRVSVEVDSGLNVTIFNKFGEKIFNDEPAATVEFMITELYDIKFI